MLTTKLEPIENKFDKHICPLAAELTNIKNQLQKISHEYGNYVVDLTTKTFGQATTFHVSLFDMKSEKTYLTCANNLIDLEKNFIGELKKSNEESPYLQMFHDIFKPQIDILNKL
jgi:hypothetical protein